MELVSDEYLDANINALHPSLFCILMFISGCSNNNLIVLQNYTDFKYSIKILVRLYFLFFKYLLKSNKDKNKNLLNNLNQDVQKRTREDIRNWMTDNKKITYEDFIWVGW